MPPKFELLVDRVIEDQIDAWIEAKHKEEETLQLELLEEEMNATDDN